MRIWEKVLYSLADDKLKTFQGELKRALSELNLSAKEFSKLTNISMSTLYKILSAKNQDIRVSNIREIICGLRDLEQGKSEKGNVIALVTDRGAVENIKKNVMLNGKNYTVQGYPAADMEEAVIQGINAERDGVKAIICGPITAYTLEKIVATPVVSLRLKTDQLQSAVDTAVKKII